MNQSAIAERVAVSFQFQSGVNPSEVLVRYYDGLTRSMVASDVVLASEYREARDIIARVNPQFFIDLARTIKTSLSDIVQLFKDRNVVRFFDKVGWSFKGIWEALKGGFRVYVTVHEVIGEYLAKTKAGRLTREQLIKLDEYLQEHPRTKRLGGVAIGLMLLYLWSTMADTGDPDFDWDISEIVGGLTGKYTMAKIFSGPDGMRLLAAIAVGAAGLSFPWPSANAVGFIMGMVRLLAKKVGARLRLMRRKPEEEVKQLGLDLALD
jgi:hypothetical protein